jgi:hypothetical protein
LAIIIDEAVTKAVAAEAAVPPAIPMVATDVAAAIEALSRD